MTTTGSTQPYWHDTASFARFTPLTADAWADVVVVGAGITGLTAAWLLGTAGRRVIVLERDRCASADTGHTTAHVTMVTDTRLTALARRFGRDHAKDVWEAGAAALATIESVCSRHAADAGFARLDGYLHAPVDDEDGQSASELMQEATLALDLGFNAEYVESAPVVGRPAVRFPHQARVHPRRYLAGLVQACTAVGVVIHERSPVDTFLDAPIGVRVGRHTVRCDDVVLATHNPLSGLSNAVSAAAFQTKLALYTSYVVAGLVPRGMVPDALWWDTSEPYDYVRLMPGEEGDLVIFGGEDHKTGQETDTTACYTRLESRLRRLIPGIDVTHRWSGQVIETPDGLPYLGQTTPHQYVATGFAGNGLTFGTLGATIIADALLGRPNRFAARFDPERSPMRGAWEYLKENVDYPIRLVRDRLAPADEQALRDVEPGHGAVIDLEGTRVACWRDPSGALTLRSAVCPHLGCVVAWNPAERTWDCPCHGSRFRPTGEVLAGPAEAPLRPIE